MSEDLQVDRDRQPPPDDAEATAVRPGLADDLLQPPPSDDDDDLTEEELLAPGGGRPSRLTRLLVALLICAVGVFIGVQVGKLTGGSATGTTGAAGAGGSRRAGTPGAGAAGSGTAAPRSGLGSSAPAATGEISTIQAHTLVLVDQGTRQSVTFTDATSVTAPYTHRSLVKGDAVTVFGSRAADGSVNATSIVVR